MVSVTASVPQFLNAAGAPLVNDTSSAFTSPFSMIVSMEFLMNNAVGDLTIGDYTRIGLRNTIIGPVPVSYTHLID